MNIVIVYESMHGNTHELAQHMADGIADAATVSLVPVARATDAVVAAADLLVVGGPTHVRGQSWTGTSRQVHAGAAADEHLLLDRDAEGPGLRNWFHRLRAAMGVAAAAFDTRTDGDPALTGRASRGISRRLRQHGFHEVVTPESFLVDRDNRLLDGEHDRAAGWAADLVRQRDPVAGGR